MNRSSHLLARRPEWAAVLLAVVLGAALPAAASAAVLPADATAILSGAPDLRSALPTPVADASIGARAVSSSGRTVAFTSASDGLLAGDDDTVVNTYAKDLATGTVQLVSRGPGADGTPAHQTCGGDVAIEGDGAPAISADGRWVAFVCSDALIPADTNGLPDVYLRDLDLETTTLVSRASGDGPVGDQASTQPTVDATGEHVAWTSASRNLGGGGSPGVARIYRRTTTGSRATEIFSPQLDANGAAVRNDAQAPSISGDGRRVAFTTIAPMALDDGNLTPDVYLRDTGTNGATLLSRANGLAGAPGDASSTDPQLSLDGSAVAFSSRATNLVAADRDSGQDVYRHQIDGSGGTSLISHNASGARANGPSVAAGIDATGQAVAFRSKATDLDPADPDAGSDAYVARGGGTPALASRRDGAAGAAANTANIAALSADGDHLALGTRGGLTGDADPLAMTISLREVAAGRTRLVSRPQADGPFVNDGGDAFSVSLSADGRFAAFVTEARGLGLPAGVREGVVVRDLETGVVTLASREDGPDGAPLTGRLNAPHLSADGSRVVFSHDAGTGHALVRDLRAGRTLQADRADGPDGAPGEKDGVDATISDDGQRVAFASLSANLVGGVTGNREKVFVRDLAAGRTLLAGRADGADGAPADDDADAPVISGDGRSVAFTTRARNLGDGDPDATSDVHLRRLDTGRTLLVSATGAGAKGDGPSRRPSLSRDGTRVAFDSTATVFEGAVPGRSAVYVRDLADGSLTLAGRADGPSGDPVSGDAFDALISADGRSIAFDARPATSIAPGAPGDGTTRGYLRRLATGTTRLVTRASGGEGAASGAAGNVRVTAVTADGGCVAFEARGDLAPGGSTDGTQVFLRATTANCGRPVALPGGGGAPPPSSSPPPSKAVDRTPPRLTSVRLSRTHLRVGAKATVVAARAGSGTVLSVRSSEAARLTISVDRERQGRRTGRKRTCRATTRHVRKGACTVRTHDGTLRRTLRGGAARFALSGRIGTRRLALGRHRLTLVARDAAGNASRPVALRFTIVR